MKQYRHLLALGLAFIYFQLQAGAQTHDSRNLAVVNPYRLSISDAKTSNIIFPFVVKSVDRGSADVLVQKLKGAENILQLKAGKINFQETNLSVVTGDGKFYSFVLDYAVEPNVLNTSFLRDSAGISNLALSIINNESRLQEDAKYVDTQASMFAMHDKSNGISVRLECIYVNDDVMYFKVLLKNTSRINYNIDVLRFSIRDEKKSKRFAVQENIQTPVFTYKGTDVIKANSQQSIVYVLPIFTIPDKKYLSLDIMEKNGGRHLHIRIKNKKLLKVKAIQSL